MARSHTILEGPAFQARQTLGPSHPSVWHLLSPVAAASLNAFHHQGRNITGFLSIDVKTKINKDKTIQNDRLDGM